MKKFMSVFLAMTMLLVPITSFGDEGPELYEGYRGLLSDLKINLDGEESDLESFLVSTWEGKGQEKREVKQNVFKLRDIAALLKDTDARFNITYNEKDGIVEITTGEDYKALESDLKKVDISKANIRASNQKIRINGEDTNLQGVGINGHNYLRLSLISKGLGNFMFKSDFKDGNLAHIVVGESDIEVFDKLKFEEELAKKDYTIVFNWGPWCYYSKRALPIMEDLQKYYDEKGDSVQIIGMVNQYENYLQDDMRILYGDKDSPWLDFGANPEAYEYLEEKFGDKISFFPLRFILDKEGNLVGKEFFEYNTIVGDKYLEDNNLTKEELTEEDNNKIEKDSLESFLKMAIEDK